MAAGGIDQVNAPASRAGHSFVRFMVERRRGYPVIDGKSLNMETRCRAAINERRHVAKIS
jgi:hypothetical protein